MGANSAGRVRMSENLTVRLLILPIQRFWIGAPLLWRLVDMIPNFP